MLTILSRLYPWDWWNLLTEEQQAMWFGGFVGLVYTILTYLLLRNSYRSINEARRVNNLLNSPSLLIHTFGGRTEFVGQPNGEGFGIRYENQGNTHARNAKLHYAIHYGNKSVTKAVELGNIDFSTNAS
jgi:hypothetical protein